MFKDQRWLVYRIKSKKFGETNPVWTNEISAKEIKFHFRKIPNDLEGLKVRSGSTMMWKSKIPVYTYRFTTLPPNNEKSAQLNVTIRYNIKFSLKWSKNSIFLRCFQTVCRAALLNQNITILRKSWCTSTTIWSNQLDHINHINHFQSDQNLAPTTKIPKTKISKFSLKLNISVLKEKWLVHKNRKI